MAYIPPFFHQPSFVTALVHIHKKKKLRRRTSNLPRAGSPKSEQTMVLQLWDSNWKAHCMSGSEMAILQGIDFSLKLVFVVRLVTVPVCGDPGNRVPPHTTTANAGCYVEHGTCV